jgi:hypothetical protein
MIHVSQALEKIPTQKEKRNYPYFQTYQIDWLVEMFCEMQFLYPLPVKVRQGQRTLTAGSGYKN